MILEREQIQRYLRHILIPEISGPGQKKLLDSSVMIFCDNLSNSAMMLYYLTAMGFGHIYCKAKDVTGQELLADNLQKLNSDVTARFAAWQSAECTENYQKPNLVIVLSESDKLDIDFSVFQNTPVIFAAAAGDRGFLKTVCKNEDFNYSFSEFNSFCSKSMDQCAALFHKASASLLGVLSAIEAVKVLLKIGCVCEKAMQFDLYSYEFVYGEELPLHKGYAANAEEVKQQLKKSKALIIGSGGLGSPAAYTLALMGVGKIGLVDFDMVELSNLNRQILHTKDRIGMSKVDSAKKFLQDLYPATEICTYEQRFSKGNAEELIQNYDIIIDGLDNLPARYMLNDACYTMKKTLIEAGVLGFNGLTTTLKPDSGPCYRCIFPDTDGKSAAPS